MRFSRIVTTAVASGALMLPMAAATISTSQAAELAPKQVRVINATVVNVTPQHLSMRAKVKGQYANGRTFLQKKTCRACKWRITDRKRANQFGKVRYAVGAPRSGKWFYRIGTPATVKFRQSYSQTYFTFTR